LKVDFDFLFEFSVKFKFKKCFPHYGIQQGINLTFSSSFLILTYIGCVRLPKKRGLNVAIERIWETIKVIKNIPRSGNFSTVYPTMGGKLFRGVSRNVEDYSACNVSLNGK